MKSPKMSFIVLMLMNITISINCSSVWELDKYEDEEEITQNAIPGLWETYKKGPYKATCSLVNPRMIKSVLCTTDPHYPEIPADENNFELFRNLFTKQEHAKGRIVREERVQVNVGQLKCRIIDFSSKNKWAASFFYNDPKCAEVLSSEEQKKETYIKLLVAYGKQQRQDIFLKKVWSTWKHYAQNKKAKNQKDKKSV